MSSSSFRILVQEDVTISSQGLARYFHKFYQLQNSSEVGRNHQFSKIGQWPVTFMSSSRSIILVQEDGGGGITCSEGLARYFMSFSSFRIIVQEDVTIGSQ
jgi:hypothetical protein